MVGVYSSKDNSPNISLNLKKNSVFYANVSRDFIDYTNDSRFVGKWNAEGNKVLLKSLFEVKRAQFYKSDENYDSTQLKVIEKCFDDFDNVDDRPVPKLYAFNSELKQIDKIEPIFINFHDKSHTIETSFKIKNEYKYLSYAKGAYVDEETILKKGTVFENKHHNTGLYYDVEIFIENCGKDYDLWITKLPAKFTFDKESNTLKSLNEKLATTLYRN